MQPHSIMKNVTTHRLITNQYTYAYSYRTTTLHETNNATKLALTPPVNDVAA